MKVLKSLNLELIKHPAHDNELCSSPSVWITCTYVWDLVTYTFVAGWAIVDWVKQIQFNTQNTSGWNDTGQIISITADSTLPVIENDALLTPNSMIWGLSYDITWDTSKIYDGIGLDYLELKYSTWAWIWNDIWSGANNWTMTWDLTSVTSWVDYKIQITAYDLAWNNFSNEFSIFEIDRTEPVVLSDTIINPNWGEIFGWNGTETITWNSWNITDSNLAANPIELLYSTDSWTTWISIANNLTNSWSYDWIHSDINFEDILIKIEAVDTVWNIWSDESDNSFIIDTTAPALSFDFSSTPVNWSYINNSWFDILSNTSDLHFETSSYVFQNLTTWEYYNWTVFTWSTEILNNICTDPVSNWTNSSCNLTSFNLLTPITDWDDYRLNLVSLDEAWNITNSIPVDYVWDTVNPAISISTSSWTYFQNSINITWDSSDMWSWISSVQLKLKS